LELLLLTPSRIKGTIKRSENIARHFSGALVKKRNEVA
jgi:hypothetical protein